MKLNLLADENVDQQVVNLLRADGHDVLYIAELDPGIRDEEVLGQANRRQDLLLTADKDFGELVYRQQRILEGVILIRLPGLSSENRASIVASTLRAHAAEFSQAFSVISPGMVRIRPRL